MLLGVLFFGLGWVLRDVLRNEVAEVPLIQQIRERPFEKYAFEKLSETKIDNGEISFGGGKSASGSYHRPVPGAPNP